MEQQDRVFAPMNEWDLQKIEPEAHYSNQESGNILLRVLSCSGQAGDFITFIAPYKTLCLLNEEN